MKIVNLDLRNVGGCRVIMLIDSCFKMMKIICSARAYEYTHR